MKKLPENHTSTIEPPASSQGAASDGRARCKLREVATRLFAKCGLDGTSTRDIAKSAGLNLSLISYYFGGKEGLYKNLFIEFATQAQKEIGKVMEGFDPATLTQEQFFTQMRDIITHMVQMQVANPDMMIMMQREVLEGLPHAREVWEGVFHKLGEKIVSIMVAAQEREIIRSDLNLEFHFLSMIHSIEMIFVSTRCCGPWEKKLFKVPEEKDKVIEQIFTVFIKGIAL